MLSHSFDAGNVFRIAVLPGDGIGPEVIQEGLKVLSVVSDLIGGIHFDCQTYPAGAVEYQKNGIALPFTTLQACREADAILLGAMGLPWVRQSDGRELTPQIDLRELLDLYAGIRPIKVYHPEHSPLKAVHPGTIDLIVIRENTEGLFSTRHRPTDISSDKVCDTLTITRWRAERIVRVAIRLAMQRRKQITLVDKANVLPSMAFFRRVFQEITSEVPELQAECIYVDAMALYLVQCPQRFDVIVTENMFGDILSDLAAGLVGGMGMAPSADVGDHHALFQPCHGTAPDLSGRNVANPLATILSVAMMLEHFNHPLTLAGAALIHRAVEQLIAITPRLTPDLGGHLTTSQVGDQICQLMRKQAHP